MAPRVCIDEAAPGWLMERKQHEKPRSEVQPSGVRPSERKGRPCCAKAQQHPGPVRLIAD
jgi:hypothetical protein